ncbi:MAG: choice-of-anchor M domain-containing protein [Bifidobacterium subtile]|jgi:surface-anchored protein|nr:choice-of-anchor M domain-containing protein [Bifidobacterium subtile]
MSINSSSPEQPGGTAKPGSHNLRAAAQRVIAKPMRLAAVGVMAVAMIFGGLSGLSNKASATDGAPANPNSNSTLCKGQANGARDVDKNPQSGTETTAPASDTRCAIQGVHTDAMSTYLTDGSNPQLVLKSKADNVYNGAADGVRYDSDTTAFVLPDNAKKPSAKMSGALGFLNKATNGGDFWYIPQTQDLSVLWAGFSTEAIQGNPHINPSSKVTMKMEHFHGPGELFMWSTDSFGGIIKQLGSPDVQRDYGFPNTHVLSIPQHEHMNWAFTKPGRYAYTMSATLDVDGKPQTATQEYVFYVGNGTPAPAQVAVVGENASATTGSAVDLKATVSSDGFEYPQGYVQFEREDSGALLGYAKVLQNQATLTVPSFSAPGSVPIRATFVPRYAEDANQASGEFQVNVTGAALPAAQRAVSTLEDAHAGVASVGAIASDQATVPVKLADGRLAGQPVFADVLRKVDQSHSSAVPMYQRAITSRWIRADNADSLAVPLPAYPGDYQLLVRDANGTQVGTADLSVPTTTGAAPYVPSVPNGGIEGGGSGNGGGNGGIIGGNGANGNNGGSGNGGGSGAAAGNGGGKNTAAQQGNGGGQASCTSSNMFVLDHGHIDIAAYSPSVNSMKMVVQEDVTGDHVRRTPSSVMLWLKPGAKTSRGWSVPQTQQQDLIWLGWNNQFLSSREIPVTWTLDKLEGPGSMRIWTQGNLGAPDTTILDSNGTHTFQMPKNTHTHANWDFSAEGYYKITMTYATSLGSDTETIYMTVGNKDPKAMPISCNAVTSAASGVQTAPPAQQVPSTDKAAAAQAAKQAAEQAAEQKAAQAAAAAAAKAKAKEEAAAKALDDALGINPDSVAGKMSSMFARHPVLAAAAFTVAGGSLAAVATAAPFILRRRVVLP